MEKSNKGKLNLKFNTRVGEESLTEAKVQSGRGRGFRGKFSPDLVSSEGVGELSREILVASRLVSSSG